MISPEVSGRAVRRFAMVDLVAVLAAAARSAGIGAQMGPLTKSVNANHKGDYPISDAAYRRASGRSVVTIAACYVSPEGVVPGADGTSTYGTTASPHYLQSFIRLRQVFSEHQKANQQASTASRARVPIFPLRCMAVARAMSARLMLRAGTLGGGRKPEETNGTVVQSTRSLTEVSRRILSLTQLLRTRQRASGGEQDQYRAEHRLHLRDATNRVKALRA
jgi:hypothetical protein